MTIQKELQLPNVHISVKSTDTPFISAASSGQKTTCEDLLQAGRANQIQQLPMRGRPILRQWWHQGTQRMSFSEADDDNLFPHLKEKHKEQSGDGREPAEIWKSLRGGGWQYYCTFGPTEGWKERRERWRRRPWSLCSCLFLENCHSESICWTGNNYEIHSWI